MDRFEHEKKTLRAMITLYCRDLHKTGEGLCPECAVLQDYAFARLDSCPFGPEKPKCSKCPIHCYKPTMRTAIRNVMRVAGPRMLFRHPILAIGHAIDGVRHRSDQPKKKFGKRDEADARDARLLLALQRGLPLVAHPLARIGEELGLPEADVLSQIREWLHQGVARRFGAVFDSASLGYQGALCAVDVPDAEIDRMAARLHPHPGITHCYQREGHPNLWFTLTAPVETHAHEVAKISAALAPYEVFLFPALRVFKIEAVFDSRSQTDSASGPPRGTLRTQSADPFILGEREREVVRRMQGTLPLSEDPFLSGERIEMESRGTACGACAMEGSGCFTAGRADCQASAGWIRCEQHVRLVCAGGPHRKGGSDPGGIEPSVALL